jgi:hypothetical protein
MLEKQRGIIIIVVVEKTYIQEFASVCTYSSHIPSSWEWTMGVMETCNAPASNLALSALSGKASNVKKGHRENELVEEPDWFPNCRWASTDAVTASPPTAEMVSVTCCSESMIFSAVL